MSEPKRVWCTRYGRFVLLGARCACLACELRNKNQNMRMELLGSRDVASVGPNRNCWEGYATFLPELNGETVRFHTLGSSTRNSVVCCLHHFQCNRSKNVNQFESIYTYFDKHVYHLDQNIRSMPLPPTMLRIAGPRSILHSFVSPFPSSNA